MSKVMTKSVSVQSQRKRGKGSRKSKDHILAIFTNNFGLFLILMNDYWIENVFVYYIQRPVPYMQLIPLTQSLIFYLCTWLHIPYANVSENVLTIYILFHLLM